MKNKIDKKTIIVIAVVAIAIIAIILLIVFAANKKSGNGNNTTNNGDGGKEIVVANETMNEFITRINDLNANFKEENFGDEYPADNSLHEQYPDIIPKKVCHKYIGDNTDEIDNLLNRLYLKPYDNGTFSVITTREGDEDKEEREVKNTLIVCLPEGCELDEIKTYKLEENDNNFVRVYFDDTAYEILEDYGLQKINVPVISCKK